MLRRSFRWTGVCRIVFAAFVLGLAGMLGAQQTAPFFYAYDEAGRLVGVVDATGNTTTYTYDALGNILSISRGSAAVSILEFSPNSGPAGTRVTLTGAGFGASAGQNTVAFNGVSATVVSATPNRLVAVVPAGATTGPIRVTSPSGSAVSAASFIVGPGGAPSISGFTPTIGTAGTAVTLTGANFETAASGNRVGFNGYRGDVASAAPTTLGVSVPPAATSGRIAVATPNGRAVSSGDFFVPPSPYTAASVEVTGRMAIGETRAVPILAATRIGMILFDGAAGQRIALSISLGTGVSGGGCDAVSIRRPDGAVLASTSVCGSSGFIDRQVLPVGGTYLITFDPYSNETGTATLTLHDVSSDVTAPILPGGSPVTVTTTTRGQSARLTFSGVAGQRVSLLVSFGAGLYPAACNYVSIQNPSGTFLLSQTTVCGASYFSDVQTLPATGTYAISVDPGSTNVGSATLTLYNVPPDVTASIAPGGPPVTVTTTVPGQNARLSFGISAASFDLKAGELFADGFESGDTSAWETPAARVSLNVSFGTGLYPANTCNYISILKPDGAPLLSQTTVCASSYYSGVLELPAAGVYTIVVNPGAINVGSATVTLYQVPADLARTVTVGGPAAALTLSAPGQLAWVTFGGLAGQAVTVRITGNTIGQVTVTVRRPNGSTQASSFSSSTAFNLSQQTLSVSGTYSISVVPSGNRTGSINVAVTSP